MEGVGRMRLTRLIAAAMLLPTLAGCAASPAAASTPAPTPHVRTAPPATLPPLPSPSATAGAASDDALDALHMPEGMRPVTNGKGLPGLLACRTISVQQPLSEELALLVFAKDAPPEGKLSEQLSAFMAAQGVQGLKPGLGTAELIACDVSEEDALALRLYSADAATAWFLLITPIDGVWTLRAVVEADMAREDMVLAAGVARLDGSTPWLQVIAELPKPDGGSQKVCALFGFFTGRMDLGFITEDTGADGSALWKSGCAFSHKLQEGIAVTTLYIWSRTYKDAQFTQQTGSAAYVLDLRYSRTRGGMYVQRAEQVP